MAGAEDEEEAGLLHGVVLVECGVPETDAVSVISWLAPVERATLDLIDPIAAAEYDTVRAPNRINRIGVPGVTIG